MSAGSHSLRVGLADDSELVRDGLAGLLESAGVQVVASFSTGLDLIENISEDLPDIVILDIKMGSSSHDDGIQVAKIIRKGFPSVGILLLSTYLEWAYAAAVMEIGPTSIGYMLKDDATARGLVDALARISKGGTYIDQQVIELLLTRANNRRRIDDLTEREREVLRLMAEGHSNARIASELQLSKRSVEDYIGKIFAKLGLLDSDRQVDRRVQAVLAWLRGMGD